MAGVTQPWSQVVWPPLDDGGAMTEARMKAIPAIGRGLALIEGMGMQMPMDAMRGDVRLRRPRILDQPDPRPGRDRAWFVGRQLDDYLVHGNAVHYLTSVDATTGWPTSVLHMPAAEVSLVVDGDGGEHYYWRGRRLDGDLVVHVRRGSDPLTPERGWGVLEQHAKTLGRIDQQGAYEESLMRDAAVPSVAVETSNAKPDPVQMDAAADRWREKFSGPRREPVFLPSGWTVKPLSWSPADSQLVEARQLSLVDAANILNLDAFWVGGSVSAGLTYRSPGPMWLNLLRQTMAPILEQVELAWSRAWLPHGQRLRFEREAILAEDKQTTTTWVTRAKAAGLVTASEGRVALGYSAELPDELVVAPDTGQAPDSQDPDLTKETE